MLQVTIKYLSSECDRILLIKSDDCIPQGIKKSLTVNVIILPSEGEHILHLLESSCQPFFLFAIYEYITLIQS